MAETTDNKQTNRQDVALFVIAGIAFVFLIIVICYTVRTFLPQKYCFPESINVNIVDAGGYNKELPAEGKYYLKEQLHTALMEVSGKAEAAYNEKFATLLTILSFFGVAWPLILSLFQNMNFRQEIDKQSEQFQQQQQQQSEDFQRQYNNLSMNIQRKQQQQSEDFQRQHKNLSMDIQRQQKQFSKDIQKQQKQFSDDFQKQQLYFSKMVDDIELMTNILQTQESKIKNLQRNSYMQYGVFGIKYVNDSGLLTEIKCKERESKESNPDSRRSQYITRIFKTTIDVIDAFCKAELLVPSKDTHNGDSLNGIKTVSRKTYNLTWNYKKVIYNDVAAELDECILNIEKLDQSLEEVSQALQYLRDTKDLLEEDNAEQ